MDPNKPAVQRYLARSSQRHLGDRRQLLQSRRRSRCIPSLHRLHGRHRDLSVPPTPSEQQAAAVLTAKGRIAAATYRTTLVHAGYLACFKMGQEMPPKIAAFPGRT